jgi:hypothetical protein
MVAIDARWVGRGPGGEPDRAKGQPEGCRGQTYHVSLFQKGLIDEFIDRYDNLIPGRREVMIWRELDADDYDLKVWTKEVDPYCCLVGDITVDTFPAPAPEPYDPYAPEPWV